MILTPRIPAGTVDPAGSHRSSSPPALGPWRVAGATLALAVLAVAGNAVNLSLFFGVQIIFGSVAVLLAIVWLGTRAGLIVALASGAYTYVLWSHPLAMLIFVAEAGFVGWHRDRARRRGRAIPGLGVSVTLYWILIGIPLVLLLYRGFLGLIWQQTFLIAAKQSLNGILDAALAELILVVGSAVGRGPARLQARQVLFSLLLCGFLLPSILVVALENRDLKDRLERNLADRLRIFGVLVVRDLGTASRGERGPLDEPAARLEAMARLFDATLPAYAELAVHRIDSSRPGGEVAGVPPTRIAPTAVADLSILLPENRQPSRMALWRQARYRMILPIRDAADGSSLLIEVGAAPLIDELQRLLLRLMTLLLVVAAIASVLADRLSRLLVRPLEDLVEAATHLPGRIVAGETVSMPAPALFAEGRALTDAFGAMARGLRDSFATIERERDALARLRDLRDLQVRMLGGVMQSDEDEQTAAERLCRLLEAVLPARRIALLRPSPTGHLAVVAASCATPEERTRLERRLGESGLTDPLPPCGSGPEPIVLDLAGDGTGSNGSDPDADSGAWYCAPIIGHEGHSLGLVALGPVTSGATGEDDREVLEVAAGLGALAFDTLRTRRRHAVLVEALSRAGTGIIISRRIAPGDFRISYVNTGFEALTGYRADEVKGRNCRFLQGDDRDQPGRDRIRAALAAGEPCQVTIRNYRKDGTLFWNALNLAPLVDSKGEVTHYVGIQQDLTAVQETLERLARSESSLREAQAIAGLGSWDLDCVSGRLDWSDETFRLLGYAPGSFEPAQRDFYAVMHPDDEAAVRAEVEAAYLRPDGRLSIEHRMLGADGIGRVLRQEGRVHRAADGTPLRLAGTTLDITAQRAVEDALRAREEQYRLVVENIEDLVVRTDSEGRVEFASPSYCELFGLSHSDIQGRRVLPPIHGEEDACTERVLEALSRPPHIARYEHRVDTTRGLRWLQWVFRAVPDGAGVLHSIVASGRDITERKAIETALAQERQRLSDIIAGTQVGTWEVDLDTEVLVVNERWAEMIGYRLADLVPTTIETWRTRCHPEDLVRSEAEVARHLRGEVDQYACELRMHHREGRWIWIRAQGRISARDRDGRALRMAGIHEDITDRTLAEIELRQRESLERELLDLASGFVSAQDENLDPLIDAALERIGRFTRSDRAYVFRFDPISGTLSNTHEWVAADIAPMIEQLQAHPIEQYSASLQVLESGQAVVIPRVADLPESWAAERAILELQSIQSLALVPLRDDQRVIGFVGFDAVRAPRDWTEAEVRFLRVCSSLLVSAFERARTYSELRASNRRYDQLALQSRTVTWELDARGHFTFVSPAAAEVWGYRPHELIGTRRFFDLIPRPLRRALQDEALRSFERRACFFDDVNPIRRADGETIWVLTNGSPILADDGTLLGYRGTDVDITERHRAQEQLRASEALLSAVFEHAPIGIAIAGPNRRLTMANRMLGELVGLAPQDLVGKRVEELTHPEDRPEERRLLDELMAGQREAFRLEKRYCRPDGSVVWGDLRVVKLPSKDGTRPLTLSMVEDITEIRNANQRRRELEAAMLRYTKDLEALVDLASRSLPPSEELPALLKLGCAALGFEAADIGAIEAGALHRPIAWYPHEEARRIGPDSDCSARLDRMFAEPGGLCVMVGDEVPDSARGLGYGCCVLMALRWNEPRDLPRRLVVRFWGRAECATPSGLDRELIRLIGQRVLGQQHEQQLREALMRAKERETIGHLASGVAHDFNNLLGAIDANFSYLQAVLGMDRSDPELARVMDETRSALGQAKVVTSGMLSLSRAGGIPLHRVILEKAIRELIGILDQILPSKVRLRVDVEAGLIAETNAAFLQSALLNLVLNARDAMPDGGEIDIQAAAQAWDGSEPLAVGRLEPGVYAAVTVRDTGCGMSPDVLARLFEPLFSTKAEQRGHGLGMFMVHEFVVRSKGGLCVESRVGAGTRFLLLVPLAGTVADDPSGPGLARSAGQSRRLRVLVVDDDPRVRDSVGRLLTSEGFLVAFAENGEDALEHLRRDPDFDLVMSDLAMPVLDGAGLLRALAERFPHLGVILMTGRTPASFALDGSPDDPIVLRKPIDPVALREAIADARGRVGT